MQRIKIPLRLISLNDDGFHLLVEIVVYGQKSWAVLDTGASRSVFNKSFIQQYSLDYATAETGATTLFSTTDTVQTVFPKFKIGKLKIRNYPAVGLDLDSVNEAYQQMGHPAVVGIVGCDILQTYKAIINCGKLCMTCKAGIEKKSKKKSEKKSRNQAAKKNKKK